MSKEDKKTKKGKMDKGFLVIAFTSTLAASIGTQMLIDHVHEQRAMHKAAEAMQADLQEIREKTGLGTSYPRECVPLYNMDGSLREGKTKPASLDCSKLVKILKTPLR